jgi:hypothetical protein
MSLVVLIALVCVTPSPPQCLAGAATQDNMFDTSSGTDYTRASINAACLKALQLAKQKKTLGMCGIFSSCLLTRE